jgi:type II secretory pathway pseudopilin PulG
MFVVPRVSVRSDRGFSLVDILAAVAIVAVVTAIALPVSASSMAAYRFRGDGQALSNLVGLAKMRAGARFSRARIYADLAARTYSMQTWDKDGGTWVVDGGVMALSNGVSFGFGSLAAPPPDTQAAIALSPPCTDDDGADIAGTSCVVFNSRGIPITAAGAPLGGNALYVTDGVGVYAVTITATPLIRFWWSPAHSARWIEQQ